MAQGEMKTMRIAIGMDLHKATAVCYAVFAGNGEANDKENGLVQGKGFEPSND